MPHTISPIRTDIQDSESGLRRIPLLSTRLNRDKKKEAPASFFLNASLVLDSPFGTYRKVRACYELGRKSHRNADSTVALVPLRSPFSAFLRRF